MSEKNKAILERWYREGWNEGREEAIDELMHPDVIAHGITQEPIIGREAFRAFYRSFKEQLSGVHITVDLNLADGDYVTSLCTLSATHAKSGSLVNIIGSSTGLVRDGLLVEAWNYFDFLTLNLQIGKISAEQLA